MWVTEMTVAPSSIAFLEAATVSGVVPLKEQVTTMAEASTLEGVE